MKPLLPVLVAVAVGAAVPAQDRDPGTIPATGRDAFGFPSPWLDAADRRAFAVGNAIFRANWVQAPASAQGLDGLGPLFHARSCSSCHERDGRSRPPAANEAARHGLVLRIGVGADGRPHPVYGSQVQQEAIAGVRPEARVEIVWEERAGRYGDGEPFTLLAPRYALREPAYGPPGADVRLAGRTAPHLLGLGLLEAIPVARLFELADPEDRDGDGISGRVHQVPGADGERLVGRFGWKAGQPTVRSQTAAAFVHDMGLTTSAHPREQLSDVQLAAIAFASGGAPEVSDHKLDRVAFYSAHIAVPARRGTADPDVRAGAALFAAFGCARCHVESHETGPLATMPGHGTLRIAPFTDLLLHDLGEDLADPTIDGDAAPGEWRTAPLWGLGLIETVSGHQRLLHDGRARGFAEAVLWHGDEAFAARERFRTASALERRQLLAFLASL